MSSLLCHLREKELFNGSRSSLYRYLLDIGFKWTKDNPRRGLMELPHIVNKRIDFLQSYKKVKMLNLYTPVFVDETWIFQNGTVSRSWQDNNIKSVKSVKNEGKRFVIYFTNLIQIYFSGSTLVKFNYQC